MPNRFTDRRALAPTLRSVASKATGPFVAVLGALLALSATIAAAGPARAARDPFLAQLIGHWDLRGTVRGTPVRYRGEAAWVLHGAWVRLALIDRARPPGYQAEVYLALDPKRGDYIGHWLDQFGAAGARVVATGHRDGQALVLSFPYEEGAFRDTLMLATDGASGRLLLESQNADGSWSTFASYTLTRSK